MDLLTTVIVLSLTGFIFMSFLFWQAKVELGKREQVIRILIWQMSALSEELERENVDELFK